MPDSLSRPAATALDSGLHFGEATGFCVSPPYAPARVLPAGLADIFVMLCDWRGHCIWTSKSQLPVTVGELVWSQLTEESQQETKLALSQVVALRETRQLEIVDRLGGRFRGSLWPLDSPEVAVCMLGMHVPRNLESLTQRERDCLELLGQGIETRLIAEKLDVSVSTIHTHMKHARTKLGLSCIEALISFAARYFYPINQPHEERAP